MEEYDLERIWESFRKLTDTFIGQTVDRHEAGKTAVKAMLKAKGVDWNEETNDLTHEGKSVGTLGEWSYVGEELKVNIVPKTSINCINIEIEI